jgi:hypothetical protein
MFVCCGRWSLRNFDIKTKSQLSLFFENGQQASHQFLSSMKLMSTKQRMLNPSKTNYHKEGTGNADDQHGVLLEEVKE